MDSTIYQDFVKPSLCIELMSAGLIPFTAFKWRVKKNDTQLRTILFDLDDYYIDGFNQLDIIDNPLYLKAFQIKDMEKLLPDYLLSRNNNMYELHCSSLFNMDVETSDRLPDVFAITVLKAIQHKKINVESAIKIINKNIH